MMTSGVAILNKNLSREALVSSPKQKIQRAICDRVNRPPLKIPLQVDKAQQHTVRDSFENQDICNTAKTRQKDSCLNSSRVPMDTSTGMNQNMDVKHVFGADNIPTLDYRKN